jgi:prepilin peptidase CpaA
MPVQTCLELSLLVLAVAAAVHDLATRRIPNRLLLAGLLVACALQLAAPNPFGALAGALAGALTGLLVFLPLYCLRGMAAGDVKLLATVGAFCGPLELLHIALYSVFAGGVMALLIVLAKGRLRAAIANVRSLLRPLLMRLAGLPAVPQPLAGASVGSIPYGLAIATGTLVALAQRHS